MWQATFSSDPPISGRIPEHHFESGAADSTRWIWVLFESSEGESWAGSFRASSVGAWQKIATPDGEHFFVIAGGACYVVDARTQHMLRSLEEPDLVDVIAIPETHMVAVADFTSVSIVNSDGIVWSTPRIAWDDIRFVEATDTHVIGIAGGYDAGLDRQFEIDLLTRTVRGGFLHEFQGLPQATSVRR